MQSIQPLNAHCLSFCNMCFKELLTFNLLRLNKRKQTEMLNSGIFVANHIQTDSPGVSSLKFMPKKDVVKDRGTYEKATNVSLATPFAGQLARFGSTSMTCP